MNDPKLSIYDEITAERANQDAQWGGPDHDDEHSPDDWFQFIEHQLRKFDDQRARLVKIAALAVAGIESLDRQVREYGD